MRQILDLHIHSKYSRACSKKLTLENIDLTCRYKGINIVATGDFTYPDWFSSIEEELEEIDASGLYRHINSKDDSVKFIIGTEVSLIYKDSEKCRRIHICIHAPDIKSAKELNDYLDKRYNIRSDGRPILGMSAPDLVKICLKINPKFLIYPAHIWTPWFSMFGSKSGFDSLEECFHDQADYIFAYETGLSSDPEMNFRVSQLDNLTLLSNSDAHSPANIAREANIFDLKNITYNEIYRAIKHKDLSVIKSTIEFYPEEGMYHIDGHRACNYSCDFNTTKKLKQLCPKCGKQLVIGVEHRVNELANRKSGIKPKKSYEYKKLVELDKIIAEAVDVKSRTSKKVITEYDKLINKLGNELDILMNIDPEIIKKYTLPSIAEGVKRMRAGNLHVTPGYDGKYGEVKIFSPEEKKQNKQLKLI